MVGAAATAVGINMTFLLPYSMLSKKWGREHRGLAIFDLSTGMVIPYVLAVSCVVIASAYMFHGQPYDGLLVEENGQVRVVEDSAGAKDFTKLISKRKGAAPELSDLQVGQAETRLAAMLVPRSTANFANSLSALSGEGSVSQFIFGLGVLAMALVHHFHTLPDFWLCFLRGPWSLPWREVCTRPAFSPVCSVCFGRSFGTVDPRPTWRWLLPHLGMCFSPSPAWLSF